MPASATWRWISCSDWASAARSRTPVGTVSTRRPAASRLKRCRKRVDVDLLVGAQAFGARRHLHLEALALGREADRVAQLGIAEGDGSRILLALDATHLAAGRQGQRAQQREGNGDAQAGPAASAGTVHRSLIPSPPGYSTMKPKSPS